MNPHLIAIPIHPPSAISAVLVHVTDSRLLFLGSVDRFGYRWMP